jgi:hypothetical protein
LIGEGVLTPREALYYGLVPALIYLANKGTLPHAKQREAIKGCHDLVNDDSIRELLLSFFDGNPDHIYPLLLRLMDTQDDGKVGVPDVKTFGNNSPYH